MPSGLDRKRRPRCLAASAHARDALLRFVAAVAVASLSLAQALPDDAASTASFSLCHLRVHKPFDDVHTPESSGAEAAGASYLAAVFDVRWEAPVFLEVPLTTAQTSGNSSSPPSGDLSQAKANVTERIAAGLDRRATPYERHAHAQKLFPALAQLGRLCCAENLTIEFADLSTWNHYLGEAASAPSTLPLSSSASLPAGAPPPRAFAFPGGFRSSYQLHHSDVHLFSTCFQDDLAGDGAEDWRLWLVVPLWARPSASPRRLRLLEPSSLRDCRIQWTGQEHSPLKGELPVQRARVFRREADAFLMHPSTNRTSSSPRGPAPRAQQRDQGQEPANEGSVGNVDGPRWASPPNQTAPTSQAASSGGPDRDDAGPSRNGGVHRQWMASRHCAPLLTPSSVFAELQLTQASRAEEHAATAMAIIQPLFDIFLKPLFDQFISSILGNLPDTITQAVGHAVGAAAPGEAAQLIAAGLIPNITNLMVDSLTHELTLRLADRLSLLLTPHLARSVTAALVPPLHNRLHERLAKEIPRRLDVTLPTQMYRSLRVLLPPRLIRAVVPALTIALTHSLAAGDNALPCSLCVQRQDPAQCAECRGAAAGLYSHSYYASYYAGYYAFYYASYWTEHLELLDAVEFKGNQAPDDVLAAAGIVPDAPLKPAPHRSRVTELPRWLFPWA